MKKFLAVLAIVAIAIVVLTPNTACNNGGNGEPEDSLENPKAAPDSSLKVQEVQKN